MASAAEQLASNLSWSALGKAKELRQRIVFALALLVIYRLGTYIPMPGIDPAQLARFIEQTQGGILGVFNMFSGGALEMLSVFALGIMPYISASIILQLLTVVIPALALDALASLYQVICFPIYGIPRVKRSEYVVIDRHALQYLNRLEKLNCVYCGYFNGLMGYLREIAARTEQYWCPIRHARPVKSVHSRYRRFFEYGDGKAYHDGLAEVRKKFDDLK